MKEGITIEDLEKIYKQEYGRLLNYARALIGSTEDSREIVNDVFMAMWRNRAGIDMERNLGAYLRRAVKNRCINYFKAKRMQKVDLEEKSYFLTNSEDVHDLIEVAELRAFLFDAIDTLPPKCKEIFILSREENLSHKEIAARLDLSVKTIENQISIALRKLRKILEDSAFNNIL